MAKQRWINTKFWDDEWIVELAPDEKLVYLYLITNPLTTIAGCYEISVRRVAFDTGLDGSRVRQILAAFESAGKVVYRDGWLLIRAFIKNQSNNPKVRRGIIEVVKHCPDWVKDSLSIPIDSLSKDTKYLDSDSDSDLKEEKKDAAKAATSRKVQTFEEVVSSLASEPAYRGINVQHEAEKAVVWIKGHKGRKFTKTFFLNWLNKCEPAIEPEKPKERELTEMDKRHIAAEEEYQRERVASALRPKVQKDVPVDIFGFPTLTEYLEASRS